MIERNTNKLSQNAALLQQKYFSCITVIGWLKKVINNKDSNWLVNSLSPENSSSNYPIWPRKWATVTENCYEHVKLNQWMLSFKDLTETTSKQCQHSFLCWEAIQKKIFLCMLISMLVTTTQSMNSIGLELKYCNCN